jgi:hypothetical protein
VAYNGFKFDGRILLKKLVDFGLLNAFANVVVGFVDPLVAAREHFRHLPSKTMEAMMVTTLLGIYCPLH